MAKTYKVYRRVCASRPGILVLTKLIYNIYYNDFKRLVLL